jgi:glycosyl transferase family 25
MINIEKLFIIHFEKLTDRKKYLDSQIKNYGFINEYILSNNKTDQQIYESNKYYKYDSSIYDRKLSKGEICVGAQHINTYIKMINNNIKYALIIEDDAIFEENFLENLHRITNELPIDFDMCFISECCNLHITNSHNLINKSDTSRCVSGYIVNSKCIPYILNTLPFQYPIDWHLNIINKNNELKFYWSEPCIIKQGSEFIYKSNLR